jgi:hypothetical protein
VGPAGRHPCRREAGLKRSERAVSEDGHAWLQRRVACRVDERVEKQRHAASLGLHVASFVLTADIVVL